MKFQIYSMSHVPELGHKAPAVPPVLPIFHFARSDTWAN